MIRALVGNAVYPKGERGGEKIIANAAKAAEMLLFVEAREVDKTGGLDPEVWDTVHWMRDDGTKGNFFAIEQEYGTVLNSNLVGHISVRGLNDRHILKVRTHISDMGILTVFILHPPPMRYWAHWPKMMRLLIREIKKTNGPILVGGDMNKLQRAVVATFSAVRRRKQFRFKHIIGAIAVGPIVLGKAEKININSDHPGVRFKIAGLRKSARKIFRRRKRKKLLRRRAKR